jgi:hypothetical protein
MYETPSATEEII